VKWFLHYSGLLTTFGGSQEIFAAGLAAAGCQARSKKDVSSRRRRDWGALAAIRSELQQQKRREQQEAARDWAPE